MHRVYWIFLVYILHREAVGYSDCSHDTQKLKSRIVSIFPSIQLCLTPQAYFLELISINLDSPYFCLHFLV